MAVLRASLYYKSIWYHKPAFEQIYVLFASMFYYNTFCYIVVKYFDSFTLSCLFVEQSVDDLSRNKHV